MPFNEMSSNVKNTMAVVADERSRLVAILSSLTDGVVMTDARGKDCAGQPGCREALQLQRNESN